MREFVGAVLASPWKEQYGVVDVAQLEALPLEYHRVKELEGRFRTRLRAIGTGHKDLVFVAPMYGRFALFVERLAGDENATRGDVLGASEHGLTFGTQRAAIGPKSELVADGGRPTVRVPVFCGNLYAGDLLIQFSSSGSGSAM
jgi:hypothetical protein